jgi:hypothetical protein
MLQKPAFDRLKKGEKMEPNNIKIYDKIPKKGVQNTRKNYFKMG